MLLRIGKRSRWKNKDAQNDDDVEGAAKDLSPREDEDVSMYRVESVDEALRVAAAHAFTYWAKPDNIDAIVLPEEAVVDAGLRPVHVPGKGLPTYLSDRHYEIPGFDDANMRLRVARNALGSGGVSATRIPKKQLWQLASDGVRMEPGVEEATSVRWKEFFDKTDEN